MEICEINLEKEVIPTTKKGNKTPKCDILQDENLRAMTKRDIIELSTK
jgi:hypothetical protein